MVENHPEVRDLVGRMVTLLGWVPVKVGSVSEAVARLRQGRIDAVIADWQLDDGDGEVLLRQARTVTGELPVPVVMISSYASPELRAQARAAGAVDLLEKPFRLEQLCTLLKRELSPRAAAAGV